MKKRNALFTILPCLALALVSQTSCSKNDDAINDVSFNNLYNYFAISSIHMLSDASPVTALNKKMAPLTQTEKDTIIDNLKIVEDMLSNNVNVSPEQVSDRQGYEKMYTVQTSYLTTPETYTFYYTETKLDVVDDDDDDFDWEKEENFRLTGIVICDSVEYSLTGTKEVEDNETEISFRIQKDATNYVEIEHEQETNERSFEYSQYTNGVKVFETEMEYEYNKNKDRLEVEFEKESANNKESYKYFYVTRNNKQYIEVIYTKNKEKKTYYIRIEKDATTNEVSYVFEE